MACGRANQVFIYHVASGQVICRLTDSQLVKEGLYSQPGVAHLDIVQSLAFSPDGYTLASGGFQEVKLWRRPRNVQTAKLSGPAEVTAAAASADGKLLAVAGSDNTIKLWELATGKHLKDLAGHSATVTSLRFSADGAKLFSGSADKTVRVWNAADGQTIVQVETPAAVQAITLIGDGTRIATGGADNIIRIWQLGGEPLALTQQKEITGHSGPVTALETVPNANTQIVSGSADGSVRHWNTDNGQAVRQMAHGGPVASVAVRADGQRIASAGGNYARLWNAADGKQLAEMKGDFRVQNAAALANKENEKAKQLIAARKTELANAEKDIAPKTEADKKAKEGLAAAEKTFNEKQEASKKALEAKVAADKASTDAAAEAKTATDNLAKAKEALDKDKENKDLAEAVKTAEKALADANEKAKKAAEAATAAAKPVTDAEKPVTDAQSALNAAKRTADEAVAALKKAEELVPADQEADRNGRSGAETDGSRAGSRQQSLGCLRDAHQDRRLLAGQPATGHRRRRQARPHLGRRRRHAAGDLRRARSADHHAGIRLGPVGCFRLSRQECDRLGNQARVDPASHDRRHRQHGLRRSRHLARLQPRRQAPGHRRRRALALRRSEALEGRRRLAGQGVGRCPQRHGLRPGLLPRRQAAGLVGRRQVREGARGRERASSSAPSKATRTTCWASPGRPAARCWPAAGPTT